MPSAVSLRYDVSHYDACKKWIKSVDHIFLDRIDKPVTNKEKTIKQIMQYAFNKKNANVSQLLSSTRERKLSDNRDYFNELLEQLPKNK